MLALSLCAALLAAAPAPSWKEAALSNDDRARSELLARLRAKGLPGLYAVQDLVAGAPDDATRARAIRALGELDNPAAEWALRAELRRPSPAVAAAAVRAAAKLGLRALERPVAARVGDPDPDLCAALVEAGPLFPAVLEAARAAIEDPGSPARRLAGLRIARGAGLPLPAGDARRLAADPSPEIRLLASEALEASDAGAAEAALEPLAALPGPLGDSALAEIARLGRPEGLARLEALAKGPDPALASRAAAALGGSLPGLPRLLALRGRSPTLGAAVDAALATHPPASAELAALLCGQDDRAAEEAAALLAARPDGVEPLDRCLQTASPAASRCALALADSPLGATRFAQALDSVDAKVRAIAAWALASTKRRPTVSALGSLAVDPAPAVRVAAALGLGRLGADGVPLLRSLLGDRDGEVRAAAAEPLTEILPPAELATLCARSASDDAVRPHLFGALPKLPHAAALLLLLAELQRGSAVERRRAIDLLAHDDDPKAYDALMQVASRDPDPATRQKAAEILGN